VASDAPTASGTSIFDPVLCEIAYRCSARRAAWCSIPSPAARCAASSPRVSGAAIPSPSAKRTDDEIVTETRAITDVFECYGYRRVGAELRHRGHVVNAKKVRRLMREHDLNPRRRRRFTRTTDSDHDGPIFPFVARNFEAHGPDQLWVADLTYVAIATGFVYVAVILDAWSRRVVGYSIGRSLDARHAVAALERAVALRRPLRGCVFHTDSKCVLAGASGRFDPRSDGPSNVVGTAWRPVAA
jgi:hypothetical protein